jgi:hypothetical protein
MEGLMLLERAQAAGLTIEADGDQLVIRGPRRADDVARLVLENKPAVQAALLAAWREEHAAWAQSLPLAERLEYDRAFGRAWIASHDTDECHRMGRHEVEQLRCQK